MRILRSTPLTCSFALAAVVGCPVALAQTLTAKPLKPVTVTTGQLSVTGGAFLPTPVPFPPVRVVTKELSVFGGELLAPPPRFGPVTVTTGGIRVEGGDAVAR